MSDLREAYDRLNARKRAAGIAPMREGGNTNAAEAREAGIYAGLDLDLDDVARVAWVVADNLLTGGKVGGFTPAQALAAAWIDGVTVGLLMAQVRADRDRDAA